MSTCGACLALVIPTALRKQHDPCQGPAHPLTDAALRASLDNATKSVVGLDSP